MEEERADGTLARTPIAVDPTSRVPTGPLSFPGKVIALDGERLAVSDSGHHRVVLAALDGRVLRVFGSGEPGLADGAPEAARFRGPQGLASDGRTLVVADTGNHAVREIDLASGLVSTLAGTGERGRLFPRGPLAALAVALRSPWDVALAGDFVLVAMAGLHQLWAVDRRHGTVRVFAGSGREGREDGPVATAAFAQPSALALAGDDLFVADSETSAVRVIELLRGAVRTIVGEGLYESGYVDGPRAEARLQHPLGVSVGPHGLLVADTGNDAVRYVAAVTGEVRTFFRAADGVSLREPGGLCQLPDGRVMVADTNQHRLVELRAEGTRARAVTMHGLAPPPLASFPSRDAPAGEKVPEELEPVVAAPGAIGLRLSIEAPSGCALAEGSPVTVTFEPLAGLVTPDPAGFTVEGDRTTLDVDLRAPAPGAWTAMVHAEVLLCAKADAAACWPVSARYRLPVDVRPQGPSSRTTVDLPLPDPRG